MCGRFTIGDPARIAARFSRFLFPPGLAPSFNVAPTHLIPAVCNDRPPSADLLHWGLLPKWSQDSRLAYKTVNARSETAAEKPMFRDAFRKRRCVIFGDGYFEWSGDAKRKRPFRFVVDGGEPIAFAGIWESRTADGVEQRSASILTCSPNSLQAPIHDRMPVILPEDAFDTWLSTDDIPVDLLRTLCVPFPAEHMSVREVSTLVNNVRNNAPACIEPIATEQMGLLLIS